MKFLKTYKLFEGESNKGTQYFDMDYIVDILQDFIDDGKIEVESDPENHGDSPLQSNPHWRLKYLKIIDCLQVDGVKQYVGWQTFSEVEEILKKWNIKNWFGNSDRPDWMSEVYIYDPRLEESFAKIVNECKQVPSGDGIATFYVGRGDTCHFLKVDTSVPNIPDPQNFNPSFQIGSSKHFVVSRDIWNMFGKYGLGNVMNKRLLTHLVRRYFGLTMLDHLNTEGYVIDKNDIQRIYKDKMGIDESSLKSYDGYDSIRSNNKGLEREFKIYDDIVSDLNRNYDNVKIEHRGNKFYDIFYKLPQPLVHEPANTGERYPVEWIAIGVFDSEMLRFTLFKCDKISEYSERGSDCDDCATWDIDERLDELSFDIFLNRWYDIYDKL